MKVINFNLCEGWVYEFPNWREITRYSWSPIERQLKGALTMAEKKSPFGATNSTPAVATPHRAPFLEHLSLSVGDMSIAAVLLFPHTAKVINRCGAGTSGLPATGRDSF